MGGKMGKNTWAIILLFCLLASGCSLRQAAPSIAQNTELLEEGLFQFRYPEDWKITSEADNTDADLQKAKYIFFHPRQRECRIIIEILTPSARKDASAYVNKITADKIRLLEKDYARSRYKDFSFRTHNTTFAGQPAAKTTATAEKSGTIKEMTCVILPYRNAFYLISYQWLEGWGEETKSRLEDILKSFRFIR